MILTQTRALIADAYRELNAKKLFWISLVLSGLVVAIFGMIGLDGRGVTFLIWRLDFLPFNTDIISREFLYKTMFASFGIKVWLALIATILALVSTAGIIPELITGGTVETLLSKPIGRVRLFLTKYLTGLMFVALQVSVFTVACAIVFWFRAGIFEPKLFLAIPIVTLFFSYLFCLAALLGLVTRSTIAALLLTVLAWGMLVVVNRADDAMTMFRAQYTLTVEKREAKIDRMIDNTSVLLKRQEHGSVDQADAAGYEPSIVEIESTNPFLNDQRARLADDQDSLDAVTTWHNRVLAAKAIFPKTSETIELLDRYTIDLSELPTLPSSSGAQLSAEPADEEIRITDSELERAIINERRSRSLWWILGTSIAFEIVILGLATFLFSRRDF